MVVLYILGALAIVVAVILFLPLRLKLDYQEELTYELKLAFFKINLEDDEEKETTADGKPIPKKKTLFTRLRDKKGFVEAIKDVFSFYWSCIEPLKKLLRFVKFRKFKVDIVVTGDDAAEVAISYGVVCAAVYPLLSLFDSLANVKYKKINVTTDFTGKESRFSFSLVIKTSLIFFLIFLFRVFKEYKNFSVRNDLQ